MAPSEPTIQKLRTEAEEAGGKAYEDDEDVLEEDVTHLEEDDDPLMLVGDLDEDGNVDDKKSEENV